MLSALSSTGEQVTKKYDMAALPSRLVTLKSKSFLNVAYRYFQCRMLKHTWKHLYFGQKSSPGVPVSSLVVLIKSAFIQLLEVRPN